MGILQLYEMRGVQCLLRFLVDNYLDDLQKTLIMMCVMKRKQVFRVNIVCGIIARETTGEAEMMRLIEKYEDDTVFVMDVIIEAAISVNMKWLNEELREPHYTERQYDMLCYLFQMMARIRKQFAACVGIETFDELKVWCETATGGFKRSITLFIDEDTGLLNMGLKVYEYV